MRFDRIETIEPGYEMSKRYVSSGKEFYSMDITDREEGLQTRLAQIKALEDEILRRETALKHKETAKKQVLLRLAPSLWDQIAVWAEDDFRSINSQIEYLLSEAVKRRFRGESPS